MYEDDDKRPYSITFAYRHCGGDTGRKSNVIAVCHKYQVYNRNGSSVAHSDRVVLAHCNLVCVVVADNVAYSGSFQHEHAYAQPYGDSH